MSVIDNSSDSHTIYWRFWSKVLLLVAWWGMGGTCSRAVGSCVANWCQNLRVAALNTQNSFAEVDL